MLLFHAFADSNDLLSQVVKQTHRLIIIMDIIFADYRILNIVMEYYPIKMD